MLTSNYGVSVKKPRYDYISVHTFNDNNECIDIPAQLLMILEITTNTVTDSYYIVSYLTEEDNQNKNDKSLFATFKWEYIINNNTLCNNIDYIKPENLQGLHAVFGLHALQDVDTDCWWGYSFYWTRHCWQLTELSLCSRTKCKSHFNKSCMQIRQ